MSNDNKNKDIHKGHRERVRKRYITKGINAFDDHQLLELLLFYVHKRKDTNKIGHALMNEFLTLENVFNATYDELCGVEGVGEAGAVLINLIGQIRNRMGRPVNEKKISLPTSADIGKFCMDYFRDLPHEKLILITMTSEHKVIAVDEISEGDHSATVVDIRKILNTAMRRKAILAVIAHNHPDDSPNPSINDMVMTRRIVDVLEGIDIPVVDHIICNNHTYVSMAERGIMDNLESYRGNY